MNKLLACFHILGVPSNATLPEVKRAYRNKAKSLHPDVNPKASAHEEFKRISLAYDYIIAHKKGLLKGHTSASNPEATKNQNKKYGTHKGWNSEANQKAREEAKQRAYEKQQAYMNSDDFKTYALFSHFYSYVSLFLVAIMGITITYCVFSLTPYKLVLALCLAVIAIPLHLAYVRKSWSEMSFSGFKHVFKQIRQTYQFWSLMLITTNVFLLFNYSLNTVLNTNLIIALFIASVVVTRYISLKRKKFKSAKTNYLSYGVVPLMLNLLFLVNYSASFSSQTVTYKYQFNPYIGERNRMQDGFIFLPDDKFEQAYYLRMFFTPEVNNHSKIRYETATGLFGLEVLKDYEFTY